MTRDERNWRSDISENERGILTNLEAIGFSQDAAFPISALGTFAKLVRDDPSLVAGDIVESLRALVRDLDRALSEQINLILHYPDFQQLESAWRGLSHLVRNVETNPLLKIKVLDVSRAELNRIFAQYEGDAWVRNPLYKMLYNDIYSVPRAEPYGLLLGDYYFDHHTADVRLLQGLATIGAAIHAPFIAGASSTVFGMASWQELRVPRDLAELQTSVEYAAWESLREQLDSRFIGLVMPHFLARLPYGKDTEPIEGFDFEEIVGDGDGSKFCWANSVYALAVSIASTFTHYGSFDAVRGFGAGGTFSGLLYDTFATDDGGVGMTCPTEIEIPDRREKELADLGFIPLLHRVRTNQGVFVGAQSLNRPLKYRTPGENASAKLSANLPYMFIACRIVHYIKAICSDRTGENTTKEELGEALNNWLLRYTLRDTVGRTHEELAARPFTKADVQVSETDGSPGHYEASVHLVPHTQIEGAPFQLSLVTSLPHVHGEAVVATEDENEPTKTDQHAEWASPREQEHSPNVELTSPRSLAEPIHLDENVQFTVYRPKLISPERWYRMLAFAHLSELPLDASAEQPDPIEVVRKQAEAKLGDQIRAFRQTSQDSQRPIPRDDEITFLPEVPGIEFNPPRKTTIWLGDVECEEFKLRAAREMTGTTARGMLTVFLGNIVLSSIPLSIRVEESNVAAVPGEMERSSSRPYRKIFACYSHRDQTIVQEFERFVSVLGDRYLRDAVSLRAGEQWSDRLQQLIDEADVFQLFWSRNSMYSSYVEQEWRYALSLGRPSFIRPTYWEEPMPRDPERDLPPNELDTLHFQQLGVNLPHRDTAPPPTLKATLASSTQTDTQATTTAKKQESSQRYLRRNRAPRVHITYRQMASAEIELVELPFVIGVLADLSGKQVQDSPTVEERTFKNVDADAFDGLLKSTKPRVVFSVPDCVTDNGEMQVELIFESMNDFHPDAIAERVGPLRQLLQTRQFLNAPRGKIESFRSGLEKLRASIDEKLTLQLNEIVHHADFQRLESTWRGLLHLVNNTETDETLRVTVLDVSKKELGEAVCAGDRVSWDLSPFFHKLNVETDLPGGRPIGVLLGDYDFDHSRPDVALLKNIAAIAAAAHVPFIAAASPTIFGAKSWRDLSDARPLAEITASPRYLPWKSLRESLDAQYVVLTVPQFLARLPYGKPASPEESFQFEEATDHRDQKGFVWANSAYLLGVSIADSFRRYGWFGAMSHGQRTDVFTCLLQHTFVTHEGGMESTGPLEDSISPDLAKELLGQGLTVLHHRNRTDGAEFLGIPSLHRPSEAGRSSSDASANAVPTLPLVLTSCRFVHYIKVMCRDSIGAYVSREDLESSLNNWLSQYIDEEAADSSLSHRARKPLGRHSRIDLSEVPGEPGCYQATVRLALNYQFGSLPMDVCATLVARLVKRG